MYLGDTEKKTLVLRAEEMQALGITVNPHDKLPDVMLFDQKRRWLFLVEAVSSEPPAFIRLAGASIGKPIMQPCYVPR